MYQSSKKVSSESSSKHAVMCVFMMVAGMSLRPHTGHIFSPGVKLSQSACEEVAAEWDEEDWEPSRSIIVPRDPVAASRDPLVLVEAARCEDAGESSKSITVLLQVVLMLAIGVSVSNTIQSSTAHDGEDVPLAVSAC